MTTEEEGEALLARVAGLYRTTWPERPPVGEKVPVLWAGGRAIPLPESYDPEIDAVT